MIRKHLTLAVIASLLSLAVAEKAIAAPPPGLRWGDTAFGSTSPSRGRSVAPPTSSYSAPAYRAPLYSAPASNAVVVSPPVVTSPLATAIPSATTINIRGADGVLRSYPLQGAIVQQPVPQSYIWLRGSDGIYRAYPVVSTTVVGPQK